jgi:hypothetical protein
MLPWPSLPGSFRENKVSLPLMCPFLASRREAAEVHLLMSQDARHVDEQIRLRKDLTRTSGSM